MLLLECVCLFCASSAVVPAITGSIIFYFNTIIFLEQQHRWRGDRVRD